MTQTRSLILAALVLMIAASCGLVCAQRRERLPALRDPQFYAPRNQLEDFDGRMETILIKGRTWVGTVRGQNGTARVEATEIRDPATSKRAAGVVVTVIADGGPPGEIRSLIDYEEIDALVKAIDTALKAGEAVTKLTHFEVRYRTRGDFEVMVFKQLSDNAIAAAIEGGFFDRSRVYLTLDEMTRLRWMMVQAKERLDESK